MKIVVTENYDASSAYVADMIAALIAEKPNCKLGLATGGTPVVMYEKLIAAYNAGKVDFSGVRSVNLDEYVGLPGTHEQSYRYFMDSHLFNHVNIDKTNTFVANGLGDAEANAAELEAKVYEGGNPDLQLLGIGNNGHIAFNEAADTLHAKAHVETLTESTIDSNARFFETRDEVPTTAITMGMGGIMAANCVVLLATGLSKADAIRGLVNNDVITTQNPSSLLKLHGNVVVVIDKELADAAGYTE